MKQITEEEFKKLEKPNIDIEKDKEKVRGIFRECYYNLIDILKSYLDMEEKYYPLIALWIMGTYHHEKFPSYPFLFFNAMKGSGKSRTINLIATLSKDGSVQNSMTEAVLFRTKGTLAIDEYEGVNRKGAENLRELLNSGYKRGVKIKRMKQIKTKEGTEYQVEEYDAYRPIVLANIWGMESVLGDRCIKIVLERSDNQKITNLVEIFNEEKIVKETKKLLNQCSLCRCSFSAEVYLKWNSYVRSNYTNIINNINNINNINYTEAFKTIKSMDLNGRELELSFPLCLLALEVGNKILKETTLILKEVFDDKKTEEFAENLDISLYDFVSQQSENLEFKTVQKITNEFREFLGSESDEINSKWMGRALKRLNLRKDEKRIARGVSVNLNVKKAKEKIKMFK